jgi:hypothetical protein
MPIVITRVPAPGLKGHVWKIEDERELARLVARVYLGNARHVEKILRKLKPDASAPPVSEGAAKSAKKLLSLSSDHRDGLLFQAISWIVAQNQATRGSIVKLPHLIAAHKGFDGLQIDLGPKKKLVGITIFEDKATKNSRATITSEVWPEFKKLEGGERENELMQEATALLERARKVDVDKAIEGIVWERLRRYRVSVTGDATHGTASGFKDLFKGYDSVAPGDDIKRLAGVVCFKDLRVWMEAFAQKVSKAIDKEKNRV